MTEYAFLSKYLSKNVQVVVQVVNNKKVMAKTPREAKLYGNWCVRKGLKATSVIPQQWVQSHREKCKVTKNRKVASWVEVVVGSCKP